MAEKAKTSLEKVIQTAINSALLETHTCMPGTITRVSGQKVDVQPTIKRKMNGILVNLPLLTDVPYRTFKTSKFSFSLPPVEGDDVLVLIAERSIDTWLTYGGIQNPADIRKHHLSDAIAFPMLYADADEIPDYNSTDAEIKTNTGNTKIVLKESEGVDIITTAPVNIETSEANITASGDVNVDAEGDVNIETSLGDANLTAVAGDVNVDGINVNVTAAAKAVIEAPTIELGAGATAFPAQAGIPTAFNAGHAHTQLSNFTKTRAS